MGGLNLFIQFSRSGQISFLAMFKPFPITFQCLTPLLCPEPCEPQCPRTDTPSPKVPRPGCAGWAVRGQRNWLDGHSQGGVVSGSMAGCRQGMRGVPQGGLCLGPGLWNGFANDTGSGWSCPQQRLCRAQAIERGRG